MSIDPNNLTAPELIQLIVRPMVDSDTLRIVGHERALEMIQAIFLSGLEDPWPMVHELIQGYERVDEQIAAHAAIYADTALKLFVEQLSSNADVNHDPPSMEQQAARPQEP